MSVRHSMCFIDKLKCKRFHQRLSNKFSSIRLQKLTQWVVLRPSKFLISGRCKKRGVEGISFPGSFFYLTLRSEKWDFLKITLSINIDF